jgi:cell volume regulation protein A
MAPSGVGARRWRPGRAAGGREGRDVDAGLAADPLLFAGAALLVAGVISAAFAERLRAPGLLLFLGLGMVMGRRLGHQLSDTMGATGAWCHLTSGSSPPPSLSPVLSRHRARHAGRIRAVARGYGVRTSSHRAARGAVVAGRRSGVRLRRAPLPGSARSSKRSPGATTPWRSSSPSACSPRSTAPWARSTGSSSASGVVGGAAVGLVVGWLGAWGLSRSRLGSIGLYSVLGLGVAGSPTAVP